MPNGAATAHLLLPKIVTTFREGYGPAAFRRDFVAAITVAIVALPLSMAIAVSSGVAPEQGLVAAIVGGFVVSALSGSRFQIGGPAGAFIGLVAAAVGRIGLEGVVTAVFMSGAMLALMGVLRIGSLVRRIPHAVTIGFTGAIAVTILASQVKDLCGLKLAGAEPSHLVAKLETLAGAASTFNLHAFGVGVGAAFLILFLRKVRPAWPSMLIAVALAAAFAAFAHLPIETIASRFGGIPRGLPAPSVPALSWDALARALPTAVSFTLLGAIESLLSAKVADSMTGREHRSNMELIGQGAANIAAACFGGICVTGTIARTATNIRAGAQSPLAGIMHSLLLLAFMLVAAPLAGYVPLAALAGVLVVVAWNMAEKAEFARLVTSWRTAPAILATFAVTLASDLSLGVLAGCVAAILTAWLAKPPRP